MTTSPPHHAIKTSCGGRGNDKLFGSTNSDLLVGDFGIDTMTGLGGKDYFVLRSDKMMQTD